MTPTDRDEMVRRMRGWALRRAALVLPESDVEDAAQEAALKVWRALDRLRPDVDPWPLLTVVARGAVYSYARRFYARTPIPTEVADEPSRYDTTEAAALDRIEAGPVWQAVAKLSPRERDAVVLLDVLDVAPGDAARHLGLDPAAGALRQARRRAHAKLANSLSHLTKEHA